MNSFHAYRNSKCFKFLGGYCTIPELCHWQAPVCNPGKPSYNWYTALQINKPELQNTCTATLPHSQNIAWVVESAVRCAHVCPQLSSTDSLFSSGLQEGNYTNVGSTLPSWMHQNIFAQSSADGYTLFSSVDTPHRNLI